MLQALLTSLLPCSETQRKLDFHEQFVLDTYRGYFQVVAGTGLRDRRVLSGIKKKTAYSMSILFWHRHNVWGQVHRFHHKLLWLKKSVIPLNDVPKLLKFP
jgi:hypothetical protein